MNIIVQGKNDQGKLANVQKPLIDLTTNPLITFCLVESGISHGEPAVMILSSDGTGTFCLQTSLDKFLSGALEMMAVAERRWGWKRPKDYSFLMPEGTRDAVIDLLRASKKAVEKLEEK